MDSETSRALYIALINKQVDQYESIIQNASVINNELLWSLVLSPAGLEGFNAVLKHPSVNPFYNDNSLIHSIIKHNTENDQLESILQHPLNKLTADDYRAFISMSEHSQEKQNLFQQYLNKLQ